MSIVTARRPETPAFEVHTRDGRRMAVFASGRTEGFPDEYCIIVNRIATLVNMVEAISRYEDSSHRLTPGDGT